MAMMQKLAKYGWIARLLTILGMGFLFARPGDLQASTVDQHVQIVQLQQQQQRKVIPKVSGSGRSVAMRMGMGL